MGIMGKSGSGVCVCVDSIVLELLLLSQLYRAVYNLSSLRSVCE